MDAQIYRARQAEALAALDTADSYRQTLYATERGALRALDLDGALTLAGQAGGWVTQANVAAAAVTGNQAAASFAEALSLREDPDPPDYLDDWLREMLDGAGGLVGGYL
ncbi:copper resistance protein CopV [Cupriavidus sp. BIC8F]|uniref:copper resistance protein CopV n=1 Tax=Cupriavidus sp. BIC8F TaxID=3079014 RepID=UPI002916873C|nr:copper resistance protein CopV [Cupriavidus sp. BIC8F]